MDKLSEFNNGIKYLLICVDVFSRFDHVQPMKSKNSTVAVAAFKKWYEKTISHKNHGLIKEQGLVANFGKFVDKRKLKFIQRELNKAAVAERAIRSLKNIIYRFMEENG